jgi:hypothetical protein
MAQTGNRESKAADAESRPLANFYDISHKFSVIALGVRLGGLDI